MKLHQQDKSTYCGNAVTQMILAALGVAQLPDQSELDDGHQGIEPSQLATMLNQSTPGATEFSTYTDDNANASLARITTATAGGTPVAALVQGSRHWVAVSEVVTGESGQGLFYNNPWPPTASQDPDLSSVPPTPPPHTAEDFCGIGDGNVQDRGFFGYADSFLTLAGWPDFVNPPPDPSDPSPVASPTYITIAPSVPQPASPGTDADATKGPMVHAQPRVLVADGPRPPAAIARPCGLVDESTALASAARGIADHGLGRRGPLRPFLAGARPVGAQLARCRGGAAYYLVRLERQHKPIGLAQIRAHDGEFLGVVAASAVHELPRRDHESVRRALKAKAACLRAVVTRSDVERGAFTVDPTLIWRPCRESMSPYFPFAQIHIAGTTLYLACDGQIFRRLDDDISQIARPAQRAR